MDVLIRSALVNVTRVNDIDPFSLDFVFFAQHPKKRLHRRILYAASLFLPFARRRLIMRRPALVDILFLNPWVRARLIRLGW